MCRPVAGIAAGLVDQGIARGRHPNEFIVDGDVERAVGPGLEVEERPPDPVGDRTVDEEQEDLYPNRAVGSTRTGAGECGGDDVPSIAFHRLLLPRDSKSDSGLERAVPQVKVELPDGTVWARCSDAATSGLPGSRSSRVLRGLRLPDGNSKRS